MEQGFPNRLQQPQLILRGESQADVTHVLYCRENAGSQSCTVFSFEKHIKSSGRQQMATGHEEQDQSMQLGVPKAHGLQLCSHKLCPRQPSQWSQEENNLGAASAQARLLAQQEQGRLGLLGRHLGCLADITRSMPTSKSCWIPSQSLSMRCDSSRT